MASTTGANRRGPLFVVGGKVEEVRGLSFQRTLRLLETQPTGARNSQQSLLLGTRLIAQHESKLGSRVGNVLEHVLLSAMDFCLESWMTFCLRRLTRTFPMGKRLLRLLGMARESSGMQEEALAHYQQLLAEHPCDLGTRKRVIAIYLQMGNLKESVEHLNVHLAEFSLDAESWHQLGEIHMSRLSLPKALFCFEELLLHDPRNSYALIACAELMASLGNASGSQTYFCAALNLDPDNVRALWGLVMLHDVALGETRDAAASLSSKLSDRGAKAPGRRGGGVSGGLTAPAGSSAGNGDDDAVLRRKGDSSSYDDADEDDEKECAALSASLHSALRLKEGQRALALAALLRLRKLYAKAAEQTPEGKRQTTPLFQAAVHMELRRLSRLFQQQ